VQDVVRKFLADRGTHLAAMIAYFAILAFVPLLFLALSLLAFAGEQDESSYLVEELRRAFPESSVENLLDVVTEIQEQATELSVIGGIGLLWAALGFFSVLESAFNIVYGLPNRPFIRQKSFVLLLTAAFSGGWSWIGHLLENVRNEQTRTLANGERHPHALAAFLKSHLPSSSVAQRAVHHLETLILKNLNLRAESPHRTRNEGILTTIERRHRDALH